MLGANLEIIILFTGFSFLCVTVFLKIIIVTLTLTSLVGQANKIVMYINFVYPVKVKFPSVTNKVKENFETCE